MRNLIFETVSLIEYYVDVLKGRRLRIPVVAQLAHRHFTTIPQQQRKSKTGLLRNELCEVAGDSFQRSALKGRNMPRRNAASYPRATQIVA